jgi:hypothetical protein
MLIGKGQSSQEKNYLVSLASVQEEARARSEACPLHRITSD